MEKYIVAHDLTFESYLSEAEIGARVNALGSALKERFEDKQPLFLCVLNGAFVFAADLIRAAGIECEVAFVRLASYQGTASTGSVSTILGLDIEIENRHVIVVEDIVDSGRTLHQLMEDLRSKQPSSLSLAVLLCKPEAVQFPVNIDYLGFEISDKFVVGYGLDYNGLCRNLKGIYQLSQHEH